MSLLQFNAPPTIAAFMKDEHFGRFLCGPIGCLPGDTEYLSPEGWQRIDAYDGGLVAQWHEDQLEFVQPVHYIAEGAAPMLRFESQHSLSMTVTANHRVPVYDWLGRFRVKSAQRLFDKPSRHRVPINFTTSDGLGYSEENIRLRVMIAADGSYPKNGKQCHIVVRKERKKTRIRELLKANRIAFTEKTAPERPTETRFAFARPAFAKPLGAEWFQASSAELALLLDETSYWDGLHDHEEVRFHTTKKLEADIVQFAAHANGQRATISLTKPINRTWAQQYIVFVARGDKARVGLRNETIRTLLPAERQYCFEVPSSFFLVRQQGCVFVTGNSGKSTGCIFELLRRSVEQAPNTRGVRQTRFAVVRNTLAQLKQTCLADIQQYLSPIINYKVNDSVIQVRYKDDNLGVIESDWLMIPLDTKEDQQRLLSLNLTGAWVSEYREIPLSIIDALSGRVGRYPSKAVAPLTWHGLIAESNPPDEGSGWYEKLEEELPSNWGYFRQPGGMDPKAENRENLPPNYYENLCANNSPDWVDVHVHAQYGKSLAGEAVFRNTFRPDFHLSQTPLIPDPQRPLVIGQDFGRTPATLIGQVDYRGRLLIFAETAAVDSGIEKFIMTHLRPLIAERFARFSAYVVADPSGNHKSQTTEVSAFDLLKKAGFQVYAAPTNDLEPRLRAVESLLIKQVDGGPLLLIDEEQCPVLAMAMRSKYRYRRKQSGELDDKPDKTHPASDEVDCLQYIALSVQGNYTAKYMNQSKARITAPRPSPRAWA